MIQNCVNCGMQTSAQRLYWEFMRLNTHRLQSVLKESDILNKQIGITVLVKYIKYAIMNIGILIIRKFMTHNILTMY